MKKIAIALSTLALLICISSAYAKVTVSGGPWGNINSLPNQPFVGKITDVTYCLENDKPYVDVVIWDNQGNGIELSFTDESLPAGIGLLSAIGKEMELGFADTNFTISDVATSVPDDQRQRSSANITMRKSLHANAQRKTVQ